MDSFEVSVKFSVSIDTEHDPRNVHGFRKMMDEQVFPQIEELLGKEAVQGLRKLHVDINVSTREIDRTVH